MDQSRLRPDALIGEYLLEARIGQGATGEVWRARHHVWSDKIVAIKVPTHPDFLRGLKNEGIIHRDLSRLDSPHVVKVFGLNIAASPPYIVMEYVAGSDLRRRMNETGRLRPPEALRILEQVLRGLDVAHRAGVIHRDIKPENILLDTEGNCKVTDFSVAVRAPGADSLRLSIETDPEGAASLAGTLVYMSPEQRQGAAVDVRSDIYSVGLLLFEMLTGELPQPGDRVADFVAAPPEIDEIFARCFTRYDRRFRDVPEMLRTLEALGRPRRDSSRATPSVAAPESRAGAPKAKAERRPPPVSTRDLGAREAPGRETRKITPEIRRISPILSTRSIESVLRGERAFGGDAPTVMPAADKAVTEPTRAAPPPDAAAGRPEPAGIRDVERMLRDLPDDDPTTSVPPPDPRPSRQYDELLPSLEALYRRHAAARGLAMYTTGRYDAAVEEFRQLAAARPADTAALRGLAMSLLRTGRPKQALAVYRDLLKLQPDSAEIWNNIGVVSLRLGRLKDAERALLHAVELRPRYASAHSNLGAVYQRQGRIDEARRSIDIALDIDPDNFAAGYNAGI